MIRGFNLKLDTSDFAEYRNRGEMLHEQQRGEIARSIEKAIGRDGTISADLLTREWFPQINSEIFISHSHKDFNLALSLSGWLEKEFGLTSFIDASAWGHADDLLKKFDKLYCYNQDRKTYDYKTRNRSTAHVHMMLTVSLAQMIDQCDCVFFLNTPQSITADKTIGSSTDSPWIYTELALTRLVRKKKPARQIRTYAMESLKVRYSANTNHLMDLNAEDLSRWETEAYDSKTSLEHLFLMHPEEQ